MAFLSKQWLKPIHTAAAPVHMPIPVSLRWNYENYGWVSANAVVATFQMRQADDQFHVFALEAEDVDFLVGELTVLASKQVRTAMATSLLKELDDNGLVSVLAEVFATRGASNAV